MLKDKPRENIYNIHSSKWSAILKYIKNTINQQKTWSLGREKKGCDWIINVRKIATVSKKSEKTSALLVVIEI